MAKFIDAELRVIYAAIVRVFIRAGQPSCQRDRHVVTFIGISTLDLWCVALNGDGVQIWYGITCFAGHLVRGHAMKAITATK